MAKAGVRQTLLVLVFACAATDPAARFTRKTFIVNFGRIAGGGAYAVTFSTADVQQLSATITSNMGSPAVAGQFVGAGNGFRVVLP